MNKQRGNCVICGNEITGNLSRKRTCSYGCASKWNSMTRQERVKHLGREWDESVNIYDLIKRDGLTCAICGLPCVYPDEAERPVDQLRATVDHVTPLFSENGGSHTWDNVQVAHMLCNSNKNNMRNGKLDEKRLEYLKREITQLWDERKGLV